MLSSPPASQPHAIVRSASRTPGGTRRIKWIGKSIGNGIDREKYYDGFRLDRDEYHVGDCVFVRMDDEEDDLWVAELESLWEDKYKEKKSASNHLMIGWGLILYWVVVFTELL